MANHICIHLKTKNKKVEFFPLNFSHALTIVPIVIYGIAHHSTSAPYIEASHYCPIDLLWKS